LGIITTPLICLGIITVLIFGDYYVAFWGLLLSSISGIIQATHVQCWSKSCFVVVVLVVGDTSNCVHAYSLVSCHCRLVSLWHQQPYSCASRAAFNKGKDFVGFFIYYLF
jgi:hypothetical protein